MGSKEKRGRAAFSLASWDDLFILRVLKKNSVTALSLSCLILSASEQRAGFPLEYSCCISWVFLNVTGNGTITSETVFSSLLGAFFSLLAPPPPPPAVFV